MLAFIGRLASSLGSKEAVASLLNRVPTLSKAFSSGSASTFLRRVMSKGTGMFSKSQTYQTLVAKSTPFLTKTASNKITRSLAAGGLTFIGGVGAEKIYNWFLGRNSDQKDADALAQDLTARTGEAGEDPLLLEAIGVPKEARSSLQSPSYQMTSANSLIVDFLKDRIEKFAMHPHRLFDISNSQQLRLDLSTGDIKEDAKMIFLLAGLTADIASSSMKPGLMRLFATQLILAEENNVLPTQALDELMFNVDHSEQIENLAQAINTRMASLLGEVRSTSGQEYYDETTSMFSETPNFDPYQDTDSRELHFGMLLPRIVTSSDSEHYEDFFEFDSAGDDEDVARARIANCGDPARSSIVEDVVKTIFK